MSIVFVHGVPETAALWDRVRDSLGGDGLALRLPGFGTPRPAGFGATMDEYAAWLVNELDGIDDPIDVVGHDWGGLLTTRVVTTSPGRIRSWVSDAVTGVDPGFVWHDLAQLWQTPGAGEEFWAGIRATPEESAETMAGMGVPDDVALDMVRAVDETMSASILDLYRSADGIGEKWQHDRPVPIPGLVLVGSDDVFGNEAFTREVAGRLGAQVVVLEGAGHWWALQEPTRAATELQKFWASLD